MKDASSLIWGKKNTFQLSDIWQTFPSIVKYWVVYTVPSSVSDKNPSAFMLAINLPMICYS